VNPGESSSQSGEAPQPPRLLFGASPRRTPLHAAKSLDSGKLAEEPTARAPFAAPASGALPITETDQLQPPLLPQKIAAASRMRRILFAPVKLFWGMAFCQSLLGALAVDHDFARAEGVEEALVREWLESQPDLPERLASAERSAEKKGWRWVGEMEEIAATFEADGLPGGFHRAAAEVFRGR